MQIENKDDQHIRRLEKKLKIKGSKLDDIGDGLGGFLSGLTEADDSEPESEENSGDWRWRSAKGGKTLSE